MPALIIRRIGRAALISINLLPSSAICLCCSARASLDASRRHLEIAISASIQRPQRAPHRAAIVGRDAAQLSDIFDDDL